METAHETGEKKGLVLFVDDDEIVLEVGSQMLRRIGYEVIEARDGQEALTVFKKHKNKVDLIILDMRLPGMNGAAVFENLRKIRADIKVLLASGYLENHLTGVILDHKCNDFIQKPFNFLQLKHKLAQMMAP